MIMGKNPIDFFGTLGRFIEKYPFTSNRHDRNTTFIGKYFCVNVPHRFYFTTKENVLLYTNHSQLPRVTYYPCYTKLFEAKLNIILQYIFDWIFQYQWKGVFMKAAFNNLLPST